MDINFQQLMAEAGEGFKPIPAGPYTVECEKAESVTSSTQKPQIRVTLRVLGGDHNGRKVFDQFTLTAGNPTALGFFFDNMAAFGLDRSFFASNPAMPYVAQMLLGRQCNITVKIEPYQGVDRNKVAQYRPIAGGQAPPMTPQQGVPQMAPQGAMPMAPQPQFAPQPQPQYAPAPQAPPPGYAPQPQYAPVPQPQVPPVQAPAPWQQQPVQYAESTVSAAGGLQVQLPQQPEQQYQQPQQQMPVAPGEQQMQQQPAPMWQPSGPPPGYTDPNQQQFAPQPQSAMPPQPQAPPPMPQGVPPMPGVPGQQRSI